MKNPLNLGFASAAHPSNNHRSKESQRLQKVHSLSILIDLIAFDCTVATLQREHRCRNEHLVPVDFDPPENEVETLQSVALTRIRHNTQFRIGKAQSLNVAHNSTR